MGYHIKEIPKGTYGDFSKIREEFLETEDAYAQANPIMLFVELADLVGAIEAFVESHNLSLADVLRMKDATKRAFEDGTRKPRS